MLKKIYKFCKITIQSSPLYFLLNLLMVFGIVFLQLGMSYMFKLMTNVVVNSGRNASTLEVALPIILFFFCITFGGNTGNFSNMMKNLYTQNAKKIFRKKFLEVAYQKKQDDFYDKEMYDQYEYVKNHIDETTQISEIIFNELLYGIVSVAIFSVTISIFNPLIFVYILLVSFVMSAVNIYAVRKRVALNEKYKHADRNMAYYDKMFLDKGAAKEIRIYHFGQQILDLWKSKYQEINRNKYQLENKLKTLTLGPELLQSIFTYGLFLYFVLEMSAGKLAIDEFVFLFSIMWGLTGGITFIIKTISGAVLEKYEYIDKYDSYINEQEKAKEGEKLEEFGEIVLDNISYKYKNQTEYALKNISFTLKKAFW